MLMTRNTVRAVCAIVGAVMSMPRTCAAARITFTSKEPGNVFFEGRPVTLTAVGVGSRVRVRVRDYSGRTVRDKEYASEHVALGVLPAGYYEVSAAGDDLSVPVTVVPRGGSHSGTAVDAALSWLVPSKRFDDGAELLSRAGFRWVRDRISWGEVEPERGRFTWGRYDASADAQSRRGLNVFQVFHMTPSWARADGAIDRMPDDLRDVYGFAAAAARHYRGRVKAWEVWNEADISVFFPDPSSEYAAFLKAAYLGFKSADRRLPITQVSFALSAERFGEGLRRNGAAAYYDIFNYHIYDDPNNYAKRAAKHRDLLRRSGVAHRPIWLTECGIPLRTTDGTVTAEQKRRQAEFVGKSYAMSFALGTDEHFFFIFPNYIERGVQFGVLDADLKPYPAYAALATVTRFLGDTRYRGEIRFAPAGCHMLLFDGHDGQTIVGWSDNGPRRVALPFRSMHLRNPVDLAAHDLVGSVIPFTVGSDGLDLMLSSSPVYVTVPGTVSSEEVVCPAPSAPSPGKPGRPPHYALHDLVLRLRIPVARSDKGQEAFRLTAGARVALEAQIYNFGKRPFSGKLSVALPAGWGSAEQFDVKDLAPMGLQTESIPVTPIHSHDRQEMRGVIIGPGAAESSPAVLDLLVD